MIEWEWLPFEAFDAVKLYRVLQARARVFVVEQDCVYQDLDGLDFDAWHLIGRRDGELACYLRVLAPGSRFAERAIGRVLTLGEYRGVGLGKQLMQEVLQRCRDQFGEIPLRLSAQAHLEEFYASFGFVTVSEPYLEDGIPHLDMLRAR